MLPGHTAEEGSLAAAAAAWGSVAGAAGHTAAVARTA